MLHLPTMKGARAKDQKQLFLRAWQLTFPDEPLPTAEYSFAKPRRYRFDWAFVGEKIAVEVDGGQWVRGAYGGYHAGDNDREKTNLAASLGWWVFRFSLTMLRRDPTGCAMMVANKRADVQMQEWRRIDSLSCEAIECDDE